MLGARRAHAPLTSEGWRSSHRMSSAVPIESVEWVESHGAVQARRSLMRRDRSLVNPSFSFGSECGNEAVDQLCCA